MWMSSTSLLSFALVAFFVTTESGVLGWTSSPATTLSVSGGVIRGRRHSCLARLYAVETNEREATSLTSGRTKSVDASDAEKATEKYGLEAGLYQSLKQKDGGETAKSLLKKYGIAYLATSIPLAVVSFAICYVLVDNGVDVAGLLSKINIETNTASETAGTFAIAYAAHKAASPIRFPPTVLLTPVVAKLIGKEPNEQESDDVDALP